MTEKNTKQWNFQKEGKPFDELPSVVKRNPGLLYEYIRTGELPNLDLIDDLVKCDIKAAKKMRRDAKHQISHIEEHSLICRFKKYDESSGKFENYPKGKDIFDKFFIESGYIYSLFSFERLYYDLDNFYSESGHSSREKIHHECECFGRMVKIRHSAAYSSWLWWKAVLHSAENKLKELTE